MLHLVGEYNSALHYNYMDCCTRYGSLWVYDGHGKWTEIGSYAVFRKEDTPVHCISCGAPTNADGSCSYCGTINRKIGN